MATELDSSDEGAIEQALSQMYGSMRIRFDGTGHRARLSREVLGEVELDRVSFSMDFVATATPPADLLVARVRSGAATYETGGSGTPRPYGAGDVFVVTQPDAPYRGSIAAIDAELAVLPAGLLRQVAGDASPEASGTVRVRDYRPVSVTAARRWGAAYDLAVRSVEAARAHPLLADSLDRLLAAAALTVFPNTLVPEPGPQDRADARPRVLRRAMAHIEENAHRPTSLAEIAAAAGVSPRAVQLAFRRYLDTTPIAYLKRVRLEHAHAELLAADPEDTSVGSVAARWGFAEHSRFSAAYRRAYGITPTTTLHAG